MVDKIWSMFDKDKSGFLESTEANLFIKKLIEHTPALGQHKEQILEAMD